jgi:hypothetical protein
MTMRITMITTMHMITGIPTITPIQPIHTQITRMGQKARER